MSTTPWLGSATISAIVVLKNARPAPETASSKTVYFDGHLFLSDSGKRTAPTQILGLFCYFNHFDFEFSPNNVHFCFVIANIMNMNKKASDLRSADVDAASYTIVGDIVQLIPAGDNVDPQYLVMLHASGLVTDTISSGGSNSFKMAPNQYVYPLRELLSPKPLIPLDCNLDALTNRLKNKKPPMPSKMSYVAISGFLCGLKKTALDVNEFQVEVEKVTFLGKSLPPHASASSLSSPATPAKRSGLKFSFDTPTPPMKKPRSTATTALQAITSSLQRTDDGHELKYVDPPASQPQQGSSN